MRDSDEATGVLARLVLSLKRFSFDFRCYPQDVAGAVLPIWQWPLEIGTIRILLFCSKWLATGLLWRRWLRAQLVETRSNPVQSSVCTTSSEGFWRAVRWHKSVKFAAKSR